MEHLHQLLIAVHTFIGSVANIHNVDLQSSGLAISNVQALAFSEQVMDELMKNDKFSIYFYQETSSRIFRMYKTILSKMLFSPNEIISRRGISSVPFHQEENIS